MTVKEVKAQLPEVKINLDGNIYDARLSGRGLQFGRVYCPRLKASWEVSWNTAAHCVTTGKAIII